MFGNRKASRCVAEAWKPVANSAGFAWFWAKQAVGNLSAIPVTKLVPRMAHLGNTQALRVGTAHCRWKFKSASAPQLWPTEQFRREMVDSIQLGPVGSNWFAGISRYHWPPTIRPRQLAPRGSQRSRLKGSALWPS